MPICVITVIIVELTDMITKKRRYVSKIMQIVSYIVKMSTVKHIGLGFLASLYGKSVFPTRAMPLTLMEVHDAFQTLQSVSQCLCMYMTDSCLGNLVFTAFVTSFAPAVTPGKPVHALKSATNQTPATRTVPK